MIEDKQKYWRSLSFESKTGRKRKVTKDDETAGLFRKLVDEMAENARVEDECREVWE